jgi:hypothetical protein
VTVAEIADWDSDLFDAEIMVERTGMSVFTSADLAEFLGITPEAMIRRLGRGKLPAPRWPSAGFADTHRWSARQVVGILAELLRSEP